MLNIIFRGIKASDEVFALLFNRKRSKTTTGNNNDDGSYTEYEEVTDDSTTLPK